MSTPSDRNDAERSAALRREALSDAPTVSPFSSDERSRRMQAAARERSDSVANAMDTGILKRAGQSLLDSLAHVKRSVFGAKHLGPDADALDRLERSAGLRPLPTPQTVSKPEIKR